ncbi:M15 family metallopeptidase [Youngiibacter multivorans]|uniref:Peptidoglycan L-alanyl-D-glutamate endopeptidase CwlK n=1 Tax=Youngiibacter multivorans TaxID=937251 RepID=A0ABS4G0C4_9CLOT|nr:M15 family metallopeptidase [Youngiibacter multivorans]MBP1917989.1 peptidoglycan L-alanyl-D-glutamate endopeptidase CwlK [Youngiibacter multivorans]
MTSSRSAGPVRKRRRTRYKARFFVIMIVLIVFIGYVTFRAFTSLPDTRTYGNPYARIDSLDELDENTKEAAVLFLEIAEDQGLDVMVTETYRTQERQDYLYAKGRTAPGSIVTWTKNSRHTKRNAFDIAKNLTGHEYDDPEFFRKCAEIAKGIGLTSGYYWETNQDMPHFETDIFTRIRYPDGYEKP